MAIDEAEVTAAEDQYNAAMTTYEADPTPENAEAMQTAMTRCGEIRQAWKQEQEAQGLRGQGLIGGEAMEETPGGMDIPEDAPPNPDPITVPEPMPEEETAEPATPPASEEGEGENA